MTILLDQSVTRDFDRALRREWLETNGLGGWASSTVSGAHSRRYHGLLVAATQPPVGRMVMLSKLDESVVVNGHRFELGANCYPDTVHPRGYLYLDSFRKDLFPRFDYRVNGISLCKTVAGVNGENTTLVLYEVLEAQSSFLLELQPFVAARDFHSLTHANEFISRKVQFRQGTFRVKPYEGVPELFIQVPRSSFEEEPTWYYNFHYELELSRGLDCREDLFSYGVFRVELQQGDRLGVIVSLSSPGGRDAWTLYERERDRRQSLIPSLLRADDFAGTLVLAADQFVVRRGEDLSTIIAGYHWFSDWGRDTMISLPGICLATGRFEDARKILRAFALAVNQGMLPNRFPDGGEEPEYNTADASLWFFVAVYKYLLSTNDERLVRAELMPVLRDILSWHDRGTRYNIHVDGDDLLVAGEESTQLTWMDAKIGDWVITPRYGKAVELNALWYNALKIYAALEERFGAVAEKTRFSRRAERVRVRFQQLFWNEEGGYLYDCVNGDHRDGAIRPNQLFALSLPFPLLKGKKARAVLQLVEDKLYTPFGLRSLAPEDEHYRPHYGGDPIARDSSYHQGTVWAWLLGPLASALVRVDGRRGQKKAVQILKSISSHLAEAGMGTLSEIFDGEPPHAPRGCIAQAWSVAEVLRAYVEDCLGAVAEEQEMIREPVTSILQDPAGLQSRIDTAPASETPRYEELS